MKENKSLFITIILCIILTLCYTYKNDIIKYIMSNSIQNKTVTLPNKKKNYNNYKFLFVQETNDFHVKNKKEILNVIYTILNHGLDEFTFYCDKDYENCNKEFSEISNDKILLSTINNLVSPYNSYEKIYFQVTEYGEIKLNIDRLYSDNEVNEIENKISEFEKEYIKSDMSDIDKIKAFHDYLINKSSYDKQRADAIEEGKDISNSISHKANGPLINNIALCSGYSDAMKIYLDKINIPNYKISNTNHIWNRVYINNEWLHLDLTWDDPITSDGRNILLHKFFLITTEELKKLDSTNHDYNVEYYPE